MQEGFTFIRFMTGPEISAAVRRLAVTALVKGRLTPLQAGYYAALRVAELRGRSGESQRKQEEGR